MRTLIVHNPKSGYGSDAIFQFQRSLLRPGDECVLRMLDEGFKAAEVACDAEGFDMVVVSGGDGTVSSVLHTLRETKVPVCVFPSGTANLFSANLGNAPEPQSLARACRIGQTADVDLGRVEWVDDKGRAHGRDFALMSGIGYDAQLMRAAIPNKAAMGEAAYYAAALANPAPDAVDFRVTVDGEVHEEHGIMCLVANCATIQNDISIVPGCLIDDGKLDVIVVEIENPVQLVRPLFFGLLDRSGKKIGRPHIKTYSGSTVVVESAVPLPVEVDGEVEPGLVTRYEARALPGAARVVVDPVSPYGKKDAEPRFGGTEDAAYPA